MNKYYKVIAATCVSVSAVYLIGNQKSEQKLNASWTNNFEPSVKWNTNWDFRDPVSLTKPKSRQLSLQQLSENKENINENAKKTQDDFEVNKNSSKASRHIFLVRHGQYEVKAKEADKMVLTQLGIKKLTKTFRTFIHFIKRSRTS